MRTSEAESWVVYQLTLHGKPTAVSAVCLQTEWDTMEQARPGYHTLVQGGIQNEGEAEKLARGVIPAVRLRTRL